MRFPHYKSMEANDAPSGEDNSDPKAMVVRLNVGDYLSSPHILIMYADV